MHLVTLHVKNPSDAKLASLTILRKWLVSMTTITKIEKNTKSQISLDVLEQFSQSWCPTICFRAWPIERGHDLDVPRSRSLQKFKVNPKNDYFYEGCKTGRRTY
jgi:hypothetical protein